MYNVSNLAHISQSLLYYWDMTMLLCCLCHVLWRFRIYCIVLSWSPSPNPYQSITLSQIVPHFPSISNPYPSPYGFPLHWRALLASNIHGALTRYICHQGSCHELLLGGGGEDWFKDTQNHLHKNSVSIGKCKIVMRVKTKHTKTSSVLGDVPCWFLDRGTRPPVTSRFRRPCFSSFFW